MIPADFIQRNKMAFIAPVHRPGHVCHFNIKGEEPLLSEQDVGHEFVTMHLCKGFRPESTSEEDIRAAAMKLIAYHADGSMTFQWKEKWDRDWRKIDFPASANDGLWMSVDKCVQLFKENSPRIDVFYLPISCPFPYHF